ncbi:transposase [Rhodococcus sp. A14]|uniref:transposase n=1 Tax=Rhodococcus sp. A14 TaxID=1194106 RepID=UPI0032162F35
MGDGDRDDHELIEWGRIVPAAVADASYGDATAFRLALTERGIDYVVAVRGAASAYPGDAVFEAPPYSGRGRPPTPRYPGPAASCRDLVLAAGRKALRTVTWRRGSKADRPIRPRRCARASPRCGSARRRDSRRRCCRIASLKPPRPSDVSGQELISDVYPGRLHRWSDSPRSRSLSGRMPPRSLPGVPSIKSSTSAI